MEKKIVVIRIFSYPDIFTEKSCPMCPDKRISTVQAKIMILTTRKM